MEPESTQKNEVARVNSPMEVIITFILQTMNLSVFIFFEILIISVDAHQLLSHLYTETLAIRNIKC